MGSNPLRRAKNKVHPLGWALFFCVMLEDSKSTVFLLRKIATFRGTVAKCVGVSAALPPSESSSARQKEKSHLCGFFFLFFSFFTVLF